MNQKYAGVDTPSAFGWMDTRRGRLLPGPYDPQRHACHANDDSLYADDASTGQRENESAQGLIIGERGPRVRTELVRSYSRANTPPLRYDFFMSQCVRWTHWRSTAFVLAQQVDRFYLASIVREPELDLLTRPAFSNQTDLRLEQPVIEIRPLLASHTRDSRWLFFSMMIATSEFQYATIGLSLALALAIIGFRTIALVPVRMEQHGDSCDRHFVRAGQEREHLPLHLGSRAKEAHAFLSQAYKQYMTTPP